MTIKALDELQSDLNEFTTAVISGEFDGAPVDIAIQTVLRNKVFSIIYRTYTYTNKYRYKYLDDNKNSILFLREVKVEEYRNLEQGDTWTREHSIDIHKTIRKLSLESGPFNFMPSPDGIKSGSYDSPIPVYSDIEDIPELVPYKYLYEEELFRPSIEEEINKLDFWNNPEGWIEGEEGL